MRALGTARLGALAVLLAFGGTACGSSATQAAGSSVPSAPATTASAAPATPSAAPTTLASATPSAPASPPSASRSTAAQVCGAGAQLPPRPAGSHVVHPVSTFRGSPAVTSAALRKQARSLAAQLPKLRIELEGVGAYRHVDGATVVSFLGKGRVPDPYGKVRVNFTCSLLGGAFGSIDSVYSLPTPGHPDPMVCEDKPLKGHRSTDCVWLDDTFGNVLVLDVPADAARRLAVAYRAAAERG